MADALVEFMLETESVQEVELDIAEEKCAECDDSLAGCEDVAGIIGEDAEGLPGFTLFHAEPCLSNYLLRAML